MAKLTLCTDWLDVCSGCHMSLLDIDEALVALLDKVQLLSSPITISSTLLRRAPTLAFSPGRCPTIIRNRLRAGCGSVSRS